MDEVLAQLWERLGASLRPGMPPGDAAVPLAILVAAVLLIGPVWGVLRVIVTLVHELGHALVGLATGRRFAGFMVSPDMSGATTTNGATRGPGIVLTTLAGYPMPGLVGALIGQASLGGYSRGVLVVIAVVLLFLFLHARSAFTVVALLGSLAADLALWWLADSSLVAAAVLCLGVFLLLGAWRHLVSVALHGDRSQDPGALARWTRVPAAVWIMVFALVLAAASWWLGASLLPYLPLP